MRHLNVIELNEVSGAGPEAAVIDAATSVVDSAASVVDPAVKAAEAVAPVAGSHWLRNVGFGVALAALAGAAYYGYNRYYAK